MTLINQPLRPDATHRPRDPRTATQVAALCYRMGKTGVEVLLINSSSGRWILPKGWPINGLSPAKSARQEAWEEAGVKKGKMRKKPIGHFFAEKHYATRPTQLCDVHVFAIKVKKLASDFPEADRRDRKWVPISAARKMVDEPGLRKILKNFSPKLKNRIAAAA